MISLAMAQRHRVKRVLERASADATLRKALRDTAIDNMLVVTMANLPHADLALILRSRRRELEHHSSPLRSPTVHMTNYERTTSPAVNYRRSSAASMEEKTSKSAALGNRRAKTGRRRRRAASFC